jgi:hypothetical protein
MFSDCQGNELDEDGVQECPVLESNEDQGAPLGIKIARRDYS